MMKNKNIQEFNAYLAEHNIEVQPEFMQKSQAFKGFKNIFLMVLSFGLGSMAVGLFFGFLALIDTSLIENKYVLFIIGSISLFAAFWFNRSTELSYQNGLVLVLYGVGFTCIFGSFALIIDVVDLQFHYFYYVLLLLATILLAFFDNKIINFFNYSVILWSIFLILEFSENMFLPYAFLIILVLKGILMFKYETAFLTLRPKWADKFSAAHVALVVFCLCLALQMSFMGNEAMIYWDSEFITYFYPLLISLMPIYSLSYVMTKFKISLQAKIAIVGVCAVLVYIFSFHYPSFAVSLSFLLWSFVKAERFLCIFSAATLVWAGFFFYYDLNVNLLNKSLLLMGSSGVFFAFYYLLIKYRRNEPK